MDGGCITIAIPYRRIDVAGNTFNALFVDDLRDQPEDNDQYTWTTARTAWEALVKLELIEFDLVSLDHDLASFLGYKEIKGSDIALWLADRKQQGLYVPPKVEIHSANPVGCENMQATIDRYLKD